MISVSEAARFTEESVSIKKFKPWWEITLDYLILLLLLLTIFSWAKVISVEASGLLCIPIESNIGYSFNLAKYFNSRCAQVFEKKLLLYFPYILFLQWLILSIFQKLWLKLPFVKSKFESYHELFKGMKMINCLQKTCRENGEESGHIKDIYEQLMLLLNQRTYLSHIYSAKVSVVLASCLAMFCMMIAWAIGLDFFQANFPCVLTRSYVPVRDFVCNFKPAEFLYVVIICNIIVLSSILAISAYVFYWVFASSWLKKKKRWSFTEEKSIHENIKVFHSTKGFQDFCFCIDLIKLSIQEEEAVQNILSTCCAKFKATQKERKMSQSLRQPQVINAQHEDSSRNFVAVKYICGYLGLTILPADENLTTERDRIYKELTRLEEDIPGEDVLVQIASRINKTIVMVHCDDKILDVYQPSLSKTSDDEKFLFICFIQPSHFHMTSQSAKTNLFRGRRMQYATEEQYRKTLKQEAVFKISKRNKRRNRSLDKHRRSLQFCQQQEPTFDCLVQLGEKVFNDDADCLDYPSHVKTPFIKKKLKRVHFKHV